MKLHGAGFGAEWFPANVLTGLHRAMDLDGVHWNGNDAALEQFLGAQLLRAEVHRFAAQ